MPDRRLEMLLADLEDAIAIGDHDSARSIFAAAITRLHGPHCGNRWAVLERLGELFALKRSR